MIIKIIVILAFLIIIGSLGIALLNLVRHREMSEKTVKALTVRISVSLLLFFILFIAVMTGAIKPHSIRGGVVDQEIKRSPAQ